MGAEPIALAQRLLARGGPRVAVLVRERDLDARAQLAWTRALAPWAREHGGHVFVSDRVDVAASTGVGAWLREDGLTCEQARRVVPSSRLGASVHDRAGLARALDAADVATLAPVLPTPSKPRTLDGDPVLGFAGLTALVTAARAHPRRRVTSLFALGGLDARHVADVLATGVDGLAAIRAAWESDALLDAILST